MQVEPAFSFQSGFGLFLNFKVVIFFNFKCCQNFHIAVVSVVVNFDIGVNVVYVCFDFGNHLIMSTVTKLNAFSFLVSLMCLSSFGVLLEVRDS